MQYSIFQTIIYTFKEECLEMKRVGLFVGIDKYKNGISQLQCAVNDAQKLSFAFSKAGYDVDFLSNDKGDSNTIVQKVVSSLSGLKAGDIFVFYFSGHGREFNGVHYLAGVNSFANNDLYNIDALPISSLITLTNSIPGLNRLFILDCCRSNILADRAGSFSCENSRDIALNKAVQQSENTSIIPPLILNSCGIGEQAFENVPEKHGYFTKALLESINNRSVNSFSSFRNSLKITGTPKPQNTSWNGDIAHWENIPLFNHWSSAASQPPAPQPPAPQPSLSPLPSSDYYELKLVAENWKKKFSQDSLLFSETMQKFQNLSEIAERYNDFNRAAEYLKSFNSEAEKVFPVESERVAKEKEKEKQKKAEEARLWKKAEDAGMVFSDDGKTILWARVTGKEMLRTVQIPNGVTSIGDEAFSKCSSLTNITIPDSVTSIGKSAFSKCSSLTSITIPDSVTSIGDKAFEGCSSLTSITIPNGVTSIGLAAFYGCESLTSITIPNGVTSIGQAAFGGCESLTSITIPDSVTSIGPNAFFGCSSLTSITIPNGVTSIGYREFEECSNLTSITIPDSVTSIEDWAFCRCGSLTSITIPDSVTSIGDFAFFGCYNLKTASIPARIEIKFSRLHIPDGCKVNWY